MRRTSDDDAYGDRTEPRESGRFDVMDAVDMLGRRMGGAIVLAGILIGFGLYTGGGTEVVSEAPRYQAFAADGEVFRLNTDSGTLIACNSTRCTIVLQRGQDLSDDRGATLFKALPTPQLPAPAQPAPAPTGQGAAPALPAPAQPVQAPPAQTK